MKFVDANVFIRAVTQDDMAKSERCIALLEAAERGDVELFTSESVLAEVVFVLSSPALYRLPRQEVAALVRPFVEAKGLRMDFKSSILAALDLYERTNLDFEDALSVQHVLRKRLDSIVSYDRDFDPGVGILREEP
jgi:predicted nucleic-acid-binding protein